MAIPIATAISSLVSAGASGGKAKYGDGIGSKILGAPGDPVGSIFDIVRQKRAREEEQRRYETSLRLIQPELMLQKQQIQKNADDEVQLKAFRRAMLG